MKKILQYRANIPGYEAMRKSFLGNPNRLMAVKATTVIALLVVPLVVTGKPFYAVTLGLGALAGALSETDDHPKGRLKSMALKVITFAISSFSVELLLPYPIVFATGMAVSTIVFILIGGASERFRGVTFGALLVGIYTMIGYEISPVRYIQPILLTSGALIYGIFSYLLLLARPWSLLEEQLSRGFSALSKYMDEKAKLFPSEKNEQKDIRARLALLNVETVEALDRCKEVLNSYATSLKEEESLKPYLHYFMILQSLHERSASSHERYDLLSSDPLNAELIGGIRQLFHELSHATQYVAESLLTGRKYRHPESLEWLVKTMNNLLGRDHLQEGHPLELLMQNLSQLSTTLKKINKKDGSDLAPKLEQDNRSLYERLVVQLDFNHPRMRYALRLSLAFLIGFTLSEIFHIAKGEWILLTILFVLQPSYGETRRRLAQRTIGTLSGVIIGILIIRLFTFPGQLLLMIASAYFFMIWMKRRYSIGVIFITIFVLCAFNIISSKGVDVMVPRLLDTLIGVFISFVIVRFVWPEWQYKRLPDLLSEALIKNTAYFKAIVIEYQQPADQDDLQYRIARREAHRADNALVMAWQNMQLDPQKQQLFINQAFTLTYLNHALLSYLSAFGAHRQQKGLDSENGIDFADHILHALQESCQWLSSKNNGELINVEEILLRTRRRLRSNNQELTAMQNVLLYNIADVTLQIVEQAKLFQNSKS